MKKQILTLIGVFFIGANILAQQGAGGDPKGFSYVTRSNELIDVKDFKEPDIASLKAEDEINDKTADGPWRFGYNNETALDLDNSGTWFTTPNGHKIWLLKVNAINAKTINLSFKNTEIPKGNELYLYNSDKSFVLGKFESKHLYQGELGSELIPGSTVYIEYYVPANNSDNIGNIEVSRVTHGYRTAQEFQEKAFGSSGACNMNVNCPDGSDWVNQRNSAVMLVSGGNGFCSGALINNTALDGTPYVLTANHCYSDPTTWVFRFKWQSEDCPNPSSSPSFESLSGAVLRARRTPSDMCLVEITGGLDNGNVPESHTPYFAGWNNSNTPPTSTVSIHHPRGDIKKISFDDDASQAVQAMGSSEPNSSWEVVWDRNTTTEPASSGSPLFDQNKRIIGQLWGGGASCTNLDAPDYYGRVHNSWNPPGSSNAEQLEHWLDPNNTGDEFIDGYDPYSEPLDYDVAAQGISFSGFSGDVFCGKTAYPTLTISNNGEILLTSATITYTYNDGEVKVINWTGSLEKFQSETVSLAIFNTTEGSNNIEVTVDNPNGQTDENPNNNLASASFLAAGDGENFDFELNLDCYGQETTWEVVDLFGNVWYKGGPYNNSTTQISLNQQLCVAPGCYDLIVYDSWGDGLNGSVETNCNFDGNMILARNNTGEVVAEIDEDNVDFGYEITFNFCAENTAGLTDFNLENVVSIYPNPSEGIFTVEINDISGTKTLTLQDMTGKVISTQVTEKTTVEFQQSQLSSGVYLLHIESNGAMVNKKIVVQ